jgi:Ca2+-binding RTX toxin-like protein
MNRLAPLCVAFTLAVPVGTAAAAEVEVGPGADGTTVVSYQAAPRETNRPLLQTLAGGHAFTDFGAALTAGAGCTAGTPVLCEIHPVEAHLGDRNDVAFINSNAGSASVYGDSGDDDFLAGGDGQAFAYGGTGNDTIRVSTDGQANAAGGSGNDRIAGGFGQFFDAFQGEGGNDLLVTTGSGTLGGGGGDDELVGDPGGRMALSLLGQAGDDVLLPSRGTADGGRDSDTIVGHAGRLNVLGGAGTDWIDVAGGDDSSGPDTVSCGSGIDVVWADVDDDVARDCEVKLRGTAPTLPQVTAARADADDLLAHIPDPAS